MNMDASEKVMAFFVISMVIIMAALVGGFFIFSTIEQKQKDRELTIREREIELKAQQYPYENKVSVEVTTP